MAILIVIVSVIEIVVGSTRPGSSFAQGVGGWGEMYGAPPSRSVSEKTFRESNPAISMVRIREH